MQHSMYVTLKLLPLSLRGRNVPYTIGGDGHLHQLKMPSLPCPSDETVEEVEHCRVCSKSNWPSALLPRSESPVVNWSHYCSSSSHEMGFEKTSLSSHKS